jgi:hypothetical protein
MKNKPLWSKEYPVRLRILVASSFVWVTGWVLLMIYGQVEGIWAWMREPAVNALAMAVFFALFLGWALWADDIQRSPPRGAY